MTATSTPFVAILGDAAEFIDGMFSPRGAAELAPAHPAVKQVETLQRIAATAKVDRINEAELLAEVADYFLDFRFWPQSPNEHFWGFLEDDSARRRIERTIRDPAQYEDTLAEVDAWAWLRAQRLAAVLIEDDGLPDIRISEGNTDRWAEVKSVQLGTRARNIGNVVTKANRQLKNALPDASGVLFIRVTRSGQRASLDDRVPDDVQPYIDEVQQEISGQQNRSVGLVVVSWTDFLIYDDGEGRALYAFRRRAVLLEHVSPRRKPTIPLDALKDDRSFVVSVGYPAIPPGVEAPPLPEVRDGPIVVMPLFRQMNEFTYGIRPQHAIEAANSPDLVERVGSVLLMLRNVPSTSYSLLLLARAQNDETQIMMGFRLHDTRWPSAEAHSPTHALHLLIAECGVPTTLDGATAMLHAEATVTDFMLQIANGPERGFMHAAVLRRSDGRFDVSCAFAIDQDCYERAMRSP